jgi:hypothetical protein
VSAVTVKLSLSLRLENGRASSPPLGSCAASWANTALISFSFSSVDPARVVQWTTVAWLL